jgi:hypothetical protein
MTPSGAEFPVERVLGYIFYLDYEPDDPDLTLPSAATFQESIASNLNMNAENLGFTITYVGVGFERRGNRHYWFVQVTIGNHIDIDNKLRQLMERALTDTNGNFLPNMIGLKHVIAFNAPRYLPNGTGSFLASTFAPGCGVSTENGAQTLLIPGRGSTTGSRARASPSLRTAFQSR